MKKLWVGVIVVILIVGGSAAWLLARGNDEQETQTVIPTTTVQKGTIASTVDGSGELEPAVDEDVTIDGDDASKTVDSVEAEENDTVEKGDTLLTFTDGTTLEAPDDGTVTSLEVYEGDRVNVGKAVAHLTDYSDFNTVIQVDELDITKVKKGQSATITVNADPDHEYSGKVVSIAREGENTNGVSTFDVTLHLNKSDQLKAGMTATATIEIEKKSDALYLPSGAVHQSGDQYFVYLSDSSGGTDTTQGQQVEVETGIHNDRSVEITSGLEEGDSVQLTAITRENDASGSDEQNQNQMPGMNGNGGGFNGPAGGGAGQGGGFQRSGGNGGGNQ